MFVHQKKIIVVHSIKSRVLILFCKIKILYTNIKFEKIYKLNDTLRSENN